MENKEFQIIDAHMHTYGTFLKPDKDLVSYMDRYGIEKAVITTINRAASSKVFVDNTSLQGKNLKNQDKMAQAFENLKKMMPKGQLDHQDVIAIANLTPDRFYKFFWFNPKMLPEEEEKSYQVLESHLKQGFCGVKIHPGIHLVKIPKDIHKLVSFMQNFNKKFPIFVHTTPRTSYFSGTSAKDMAKLAQAYPDLKLIVGHAALSMEFAIELSLTLKSYRNVFFETSCSIPYGILNLIRNVGHKRVIFGSDAPVTNPIQLEIDKIKYLPINADQKQDIFYNNIITLLDL